MKKREREKEAKDERVKEPVLCDVETPSPFPSLLGRIDLVYYIKGTRRETRESKKSELNSFLLNRGQKPVMHTRSTQSHSLGKYLDCSFESVWEPHFV